MLVSPRVVLAALIACACAASQPPAKVAISSTAQRVEDSAGTTVEDCGEFDEARDDKSCRLHKIEECVIAALDACRPAHGAHVYFAAEGDAVRVDYFALTENGSCNLVVVEDRTADPLGKKNVEERLCKLHAWQPDASRDSCELLSLSECKVRSSSTRR